MDHVILHFKEYLIDAPVLAFLMTFLAGILTSFTPCVLPMIPITAAYIGGNTASEGHRFHGFFMSLSYVLGISVMYSALGAIASLTGMMFGRWVSNPVVNFAMAVIFVLLGLSMVGHLTLPIPRFLQNVSPKKKLNGYVGAFLVGVASSFIATPCTGPVLFGILTLVANGQNVMYGVALLFVFSLGLGLLLVIVGTFAGAVAVLPKPGRWMDVVKWFFGALMVGCGAFFLYNGIKYLLT